MANFSQCYSYAVSSLPFYLNHWLVQIILVSTAELGKFPMSFGFERLYDFFAPCGVNSGWRVFLANSELIADVKQNSPSRGP